MEREQEHQVNEQPPPFRVLLLERGLIPRLEDMWEKFRDIAV